MKTRIYAAPAVKGLSRIAKDRNVVEVRIYRIPLQSMFTPAIICLYEAGLRIVKIRKKHCQI